MWVCAICGHVSGSEHATDCLHYYTKAPSSPVGPRPRAATANTPGRTHTGAQGVSGRELDLGGAR